MKLKLKQFVKSTIRSYASLFGEHRRSAKEAKLWVLMYHRILPDSDSRFALEEPGMLVRPETFDMHLTRIKKHFDVVRLSDWINAKSKGMQLPEKACAISFDDGWMDNYEFALPLLKSHQLPATLFAVADKIGTDFQFWPNIVSALLANNQLQEMRKHPLFSQLSFDLSSISGKPIQEHSATVIASLKEFNDQDIFAALNDIQWKSLVQHSSPALMGWSEMQTMCDSGLIDIGSHTCTHRRLTNALTSSELQYEIIASKARLQDRLARPIELFCFPNGDYNEEALSLVKQHYAAAVTTQRGVNRMSSFDNHQIYRIGLHEHVSFDKTYFDARLSGMV